MVNIHTLRDSRAKLSIAKKKRDAAKSMLGGDDPEREPENYAGTYFTHSQRAIEHATKSLFLLFGVNFPTDHVIEMDSEEAKDLIKASGNQLPEDYSDRAVRMLFINKMYASTYPESEYGIKTDERRIEADKFLHQMEGDQAYNHADEVIRICDYMIARVENIVYDSD